MENHLFDRAYEAANNASERTRSVYYVFLIINFALLLSAYSTEVYRRPGERVDDFLEATLCVQIEHDAEEKNRGIIEQVERWGTLKCPSATTKATAWGYNLEDLQNIDKEWFKKLTQKRIDDLIGQDVASRQIKIPIAGLSFDVDLLWILTSYSGPLGMLIILSSLKVELDLVEVFKIGLTDSTCHEKNMSTRLLLSTQVLLGKSTDKSSHIERATQICKMAFMRSIFLLPIITQMLEIYSDFDLRDLFFWAIANAKLYLIPELQRHPLMEAFKIASEISSLILMVVLFLRFNFTTSKLKLSYKHLQEKVEQNGDINYDGEGI